MKSLPREKGSEMRLLDMQKPPSHKRFSTAGRSMAADLKKGLEMLDHVPAGGKVCLPKKGKRSQICALKTKVIYNSIYKNNSQVCCCGVLFVVV